MSQKPNVTTAEAAKFDLAKGTPTFSGTSANTGEKKKPANAEEPVDELLTVRRIERLLFKLPDDAARDRVMTYLGARHKARAEKALAVSLQNVDF